jgi:hypothetical protein
LGNYLKNPRAHKKFPVIIFIEILSGLLLIVKGKIFLTPPFGSGVERRGFFETVCGNGSRKADDRSDHSGEGAATLKISTLKTLTHV